MKIPLLEIVINVSYGGFSLDKEMADWLVENKGWKAVDYDDKKRDPNEPFDLQYLGADYFIPKKNDVAFRSNKDLIECVRALQEKNKDASFFDKWHGKKKVFDLKIREVSVEIDVDDYCDGKEEINVSFHTE